MLTRRNLFILGLGLSVLSYGCAGAQEAYQARKLKEAGKFEESAKSAMQALDADPNRGYARRILQEVAPMAYRDMLMNVVEYENKHRTDLAVSTLGKMKSFLSQVKAYGVVFPTIDVDAKISQLKTSEADSSYKEAELAFANGQYRVAASKYETVRKNAPDYKDTNMKLAQTYYLLGSYFLAKKKCRQAVDDLQRAAQLDSGLSDLKRRLAEAEACARDMRADIAFVGIDNASGRKLLNFDEASVLGSLQSRIDLKDLAYLRFTDGKALKTFMTERGITAGTLPTKVSQFRDLKGVVYVVAVSIDKVSDTPAKNQREMRLPYRTFVITTAKPNTYGDCPGGQRMQFDPHPVCTQDIERVFQYTHHEDTAEVVVSGFVTVVNAHTGAELLKERIDGKASDKIQWADNANETQIPQSVQNQFFSRSSLKSSDALLAEALKWFSDNTAKVVLDAIDESSKIADPTPDQLRDLKLSIAPILPNVGRTVPYPPFAFALPKTTTLESVGNCAT